MDNLMEIVDIISNWIDSLQSNNDILRNELVIEDIQEYLVQLSFNQKKELVEKLLKKIEPIESDRTIKNTLLCMKRILNEFETPILIDILNSNYNDFHIQTNPALVINLLRIFGHNKALESKLLHDGLQSHDYELQNQIISFIIGNTKTGYLLQVINLFKETMSVFNQIIEIDSSNTVNILNLKYSLPTNIPEVEFLFNNIYTYLHKDERPNSPNLLAYGANSNSLSSLFDQFLRIITLKIILFIDSFQSIGSEVLLKDLDEFANSVPNKKNLLTILSENRDEKIVDIEHFTSLEEPWGNTKDLNGVVRRFISLLYNYIGNFGSDFELDMLYNLFNKEINHEITIAIINSISSLKSEKSFNTLKEIALQDKYYFYVLKSMLKIGGQGVENYIFEQFQSTDTHKILLTSFFIPFIKSNELLPKFDAVTIQLLEFKQPVIIKQAIWIIRKRKLFQAIPSLINHLFSDNQSIRDYAFSALVDFGEETKNYLQKRINYYGEEKKGLLNNLLSIIDRKQ